jgi:hypothetical protein
VVEEYARAIVELLDDEEARRQMGREGRLRVERELAWTHQQTGYVAVFDELVGRGPDEAPDEPIVREVVIDLRDVDRLGVPADDPAAAEAG